MRKGKTVVNVFAMDGFAGSGKEYMIGQVIKELKKRNHSVGLVENRAFSNSDGPEELSRPENSGRGEASTVTRLSEDGRMHIYRHAGRLEEILRFYDQDFVLLVEMPQFNGPHIVTEERYIRERENLSGLVLAVIGNEAGRIEPPCEAQVFPETADLNALVSLIETGVFEKLPDFPPKCCSVCGYSCRELCAAILRGEAKRSDCIVQRKSVSIRVDGEELTIVPFVQKLLNNAVRAVASELEGYRENGEIEIRLGGSSCAMPGGGSD